MNWRAVMLVGAVTACGACEPGATNVDSITTEVGEQRDGFPSWEERVMLVWTNRARAAPAEDLAGCTHCADRDCYVPQPPLTWQYELSRAARSHSELTARSGCTNLQHRSVCTLVSDVATRFTPGSCNGDPSCMCVPGTLVCGSTTGTAMADRLALFGYPSGIRSENISPWADPIQSFYQMFYELDSSSTCGFRYSNGHRYNILSPSYIAIGVGKASTGNVYTQDFTSIATRATGIVGGVHYPRTGSSVELRANWYGATPTRAEVNVEGQCLSMNLERGTELNGTYLATANGLGTGCYRYTFHFASSAGEETFPSTGSYGIGCPADWLASTPPACGTVVDLDAGTPSSDAGADAGKRRRGRRH